MSIFIEPILSEEDLTAQFTANSVTVLQKRYLRKDENGTPTESIAAMFRRVAHHIAQGDDEATREETETRFYNLLSRLHFVPNSPTFTGAGTPLGQLAACFVIPIDDDMGRKPGGIFQSLRDAALIQQTGGGNGFSFSRLRPKNSLVVSSMGKATGPVGFLRVYDRAFGEIAQGGCLTPDTLVFTANGLLRLDEIVAQDTPGWQPHSLTVATDEGAQRSTQGFNHGVGPVLRVKTDCGLELTGTPEHKIKVLTPTGPVWQQLDTLQPGEAIQVILNQHAGQLRPLQHPVQHHGNQIMPQFPAQLDDALAFFIGYLIGDGFVAQGNSDHRVGVSVAHSSYLMDALPVLMHQLFGDAVTIHTQQKPEDASVTFVIDNCALKDFLLLNGLGKSTSHTVTVPRLIRQSPPEVVGAFLRGLFEADGALSHGYPMLLSSSETLIREVATLLMGLGCPVKIAPQASHEDRYGAAPMWLVRVHSCLGLEQWQARIGCDPRSRFQACHTFEPDLARESSYALPHPAYWVAPVLEAITLPQIDRRGRGQGKHFRSAAPQLRKQLLRYTRGERQLTLSAHRQLSAQYPEFAQHARPVGNSWYVTVTAIEPAGESLTLDLEVEHNHTYLANGMTVHNSRRGANMAVLRIDHPDIEEFISCKTTEGAISNFNISVGMVDAFMEAVEQDTDWPLVFPDTQDSNYRSFEGTIEDAREASLPLLTHQTVAARDLFNRIVKQAWRNGEPGMLFLDAAQRDNPVPHLGRYESTNPCLVGDTWVITAEGPRQIHSLVGLATSLLLDDTFHATTDAGFFSTGHREVLEIQTHNGHRLTLTANHPLKVVTRKTRYTLQSAWREAGQLQVGDELLLANHRGVSWAGAGTSDEGYLLGALVGDGTITIGRAILSVWGDGPSAQAVREEILRIAQQFPHRADFQGFVTIEERNETRLTLKSIYELALQFGLSETFKGISAEIEQSSSDFYAGFLRGLFDTDGTIIGAQEKGVSVRLAQSDLALLEGTQRMLQRLGIISTIYQNRRPAGSTQLPDGHGNTRDYPTRAQHELVINSDNLAVFAERIGFKDVEKAAKLTERLNAYQRKLNRERFVDPIVAITSKGTADVFDVQIPDVHAFAANGIHTHNCGEQFLLPYENCCLGSINLARHLAVTAEGAPTVDWDTLAETIAVGVHFLDNVVTVNAYVPAVPQLREAAHNSRRIGLGIMGLADLLFHVGIAYGSEAGQDMAAQVMEFCRYHAMLSSIQLAKTRGPFPAISGSRYDPQHVTWEPPQWPDWLGGAPQHDWGRPTLDWAGLVKKLKKHGIRNAAQLTIAPTGTIATISGAEGYGCEPIFALSYTRNMLDEGRQIALRYSSPHFIHALEAAGIDTDTQEQILEQVALTGSCQTVEEIPAAIRDIFVVASDISAEGHIRMQAALQVFTDASISKTINFPATATSDDIAEAFRLAWRLGCKGLTVYVAGSREQEVLETESVRQQKQGIEAAPITPVPTPKPWEGNAVRPRPKCLNGRTYRVPTPLGTAYVNININGHDQPFEVFLNIAKAGSDTAAVAEAMARLISLTLRLPSPMEPRRRLEEVVDQLGGIGGGRPLGFGHNRVLSLPDGVARVLNDYLKETEVTEENDGNTGATVTVASKQQLALFPVGDLCPMCGQAAMAYTEGCRRCYACGHSEC